MSRYRQRDRRRPAPGSRSGTARNTWSPQVESNEAFELTIGAFAIGRDGSGNIVTQEIVFPAGRQIDPSTIRVRSGAGLTLNPVVSATTLEGGGVLVILTNTQLVRVEVVVEPFAPDWITENGFQCGGVFQAIVF
jgi:hypothetical protein